MDNSLIHENLRKISEFGTAVEIRMPIVPGYNDFPEDMARRTPWGEEMAD